MAPLELLARRIASAQRLVILTGAGISAASGIPTFRGADGLWKRVRAETLATPEAFDNDPRLVWEWYDWRRGMIRQAQPNAAHEVLARWNRTRPGSTVITQNVDGLLERAGAADVVRLHGSIWHLRCSAPCPGGDLATALAAAAVSPLRRARASRRRVVRRAAAPRALGSRRPRRGNR